MSFLQRNYHIPYPADALSKYSIVAQIQAIAPKNAAYTQDQPVEYKLMSTEPDLPFAVLAENGAVIFMNSTSIDDKPHCALLVAEDGRAQLTNATIQLGGRRSINCTIDSNSTLFQHVLGGAHNLPFDFNKVRDEFLNNSLSSRTTPLPPIETTTEMPGDEWTNEVSTDIIGPHSTLIPLIKTTTEPIIEPDETLTSVQSQQTATTLASIGPDSQINLTEISTTPMAVQVADILPDSFSTPSTKDQTDDNDVLVNLITKPSLSTTSALVIFFTIKFDCILGLQLMN